MQQRMKDLKDRLRAGIDVGKHRVQVLKLGYERTTREKERKKAVEALGEQAWQQRSQRGVAVGDLAAAGQRAHAFVLLLPGGQVKRLVVVDSGLCRLCW